MLKNSLVSSFYYTLFYHLRNNLSNFNLEKEKKKGRILVHPIDLTH